jgi:hypothetical protein
MSEMTETQKLLQEIKTFCKERPLSHSTFGVYAVNNSRLVERLETGGSINLRQVERIRAYIQAARKLQRSSAAAAAKKQPRPGLRKRLPARRAK